MYVQDAVPVPIAASPAAAVVRLPYTAAQVAGSSRADQPADAAREGPAPVGMAVETPMHKQQTAALIGPFTCLAYLFIGIKQTACVCHCPTKVPA